MSLAIQLEASTVACGDTVPGTVEVTEELPRAGSVIVELRYEGQRFDRFRRFGRKVLGEGPFQKGETLPFELAVPETGPHSFQGRLHTVDWHVWATAEVTLGSDPEARAELEVTPRVLESAEELRAEPPASEEGKVEEHGCVMRALMALVLVLIAPMLPLAYLLAYTAAFLSAGPSWARVRARLGEARVSIPDRGFPMASWLPVTVELPIRAAVDVARIEFVFQGVERWDPGSRQPTHLQPFHEATVDTLEGTVLVPEPGADASVLRLTEVLLVPPETLPTVEGGDGQSCVYHVVAVQLHLADGTEHPIGKVNPRVVSVITIDMGPQPPFDSPEEASTGLRFVSSEEESLPVEVEKALASSPLARPFFLAVAGLPLLLSGLYLLLFLRKTTPGLGLVASGAVVLIGGLLWLFRRIFG